MKNTVKLYTQITDVPKCVIHPRPQRSVRDLAQTIKEFHFIIVSLIQLTERNEERNFATLEN